MNEIESRILAVLERHQPCTMEDIRQHLPDNYPEAVKRHAKKLAEKGRIINQGKVNKGRWTLVGVDIEELTIRSKPEPKPAPPTDNLAPGRLISKIAGIYVPPKSHIRPEALDHEDCMSLHAGIRKPYTGQPLTLGVKAK